MIAIENIEPDPNQPRRMIDPAHMEELTKSVKQLGILQPISVQYIEAQDCYRIIAGECRFTAAKAAHLREIPCWVKTPKAEEVLLEQIVENWQRSNLNPFELADSLAILRDANGYSQTELVRQTGKSKGEISKLLKILELDERVQSLARQDTSGHISRRHLYSLARLDVEGQTLLLKRIQREELTALETEKLVSRYMQKNDKPKQPGAPVTRRKFETKSGTVLFTYRKQRVSDTDLLMTLREVKKQIIERSSDPADLH